MLKRFIPALILVLAFAGCTMAPKYERPAANISASWPEGGAYKASSAEGKAADISWKDYFRSESLTKLIELALENNKDLKIAALNIEKAAAAYRIQQSALFPDVTAGASATRQGVPDNISATGKSYTSSVYRANVNASYELDFFGKIRSLNQKALETYLATDEAHKSAKISLIAEVTNAYCAYLADRRLLELAQNTYSAQKQTYDVIKKKFDLGSGSELDVTQAEVQVETAKASFIQYTRLTAQAKNAIVLLAGAPVDGLLDGETIDSLSFMTDLPEGVPSQVLTSRPDIIAAEHSLMAANADIGAARAALFPSISLTGSFGLASDSLDTLFTSGAAYAWNFTPSLSIPIFNRGRIKANLEVAKVSEKIAAEQYEKALQTAFREVADQLAARGTYKDELSTQETLVNTSRKAFDLASLRYDNGITSYLNVLDAQRSLFAAEQKAVGVKQQYLTNLVTLYKVLGGGQI